MKLKTACPECKTSLTVDAELVGGNARCPRCGNKFVVASVRTPSSATSLVQTEEATATVSIGQGSPTAVSPSPVTVPVKTLGRFELQTTLGQGGFGRVYRAYDPQLDRLLALKVPTFSSKDGNKARRFQSEAKAAAQLRHPNIVPTFESGKIGNQYFIASQYIDGQAMSEITKAGPTKAKLAAQWVSKIARALAYAHEMGIVHRDVKPHNVMLDKRGEPQLMDFGLAKRVNEDSSMTTEGSLLGTPSYMAPEQARGDMANVGPHSDQYALGAILYELLTGKRAFDGAPHTVLARILSEEPVALRSLIGEIPPDLEAITLKAMSKEIAGRYASCNDLADDLDRWLAGDPTTARPMTNRERLVRWAKRNRSVAAVLGVVTVACVLIGLMGVALASYQAYASRQVSAAAARVQDEQKKTLEALSTATEERDRANERDDASKRLLYGARMNLAQSAWKDAHVDRAAQLISDYSPSSDSSNLIGFEWHYWNRLFQHGFRIWEGHKEPTQCVAFSPDGKRVVSASTDKTAKVWDIAENKEVLTIVGHTDIVRSVAYHPQGELIATGSYDKTIRLWDSTSGEMRMTLEGHTDKLLFVAFSPDGRRLVSTSNDGVVIVWDTVSGKRVFVKETGSFGVRCGAFSPDGTRLAIGCYGNRMAMLDATSGAELRMFIGHALVVTSVCFSPNGSQIASGSWDQSIRIWDPETGRELKTLRGHEAEVTAVAFTADGTKIASSSFDRTIRIWNVNDGIEAHRLVGHRGLVYSVAVSPDGTTIASGGGDSSVRLWRPDTDPERKVLRGHGGGWTLNGYTGSIHCVTFSADGKQFASGGGDGTVVVWNAATGEAVRTLNGHRGAVRCIAFSPENREVATASDDETLRFWDPASGKELATLEGHRGAIHCVSFSPDGQHVVSAGDDKSVIVWNRRTRQAERTLQGHSEPVRSVTFSPNGRYLATGGLDGTLLLWSVPAWESTPVVLGQTGLISDLCFNSDSSRIATASVDNAVRVWDILSEKTTSTLNSGTCHGVVFTPDGRRVVTARGVVKVWDAVSGQETLTLRGTKAAQVIYSVAVSPDGAQIVACTKDGEVILWDSQP